MKNPYTAKIFIVMVACIVFIFAFTELGVKTYRAYFSGDLFAVGTMIGPVDVSGLTKDEAKTKLQSEINNWQTNGEITLIYGGIQDTVTKGEVVDFSVDAIVQTAKSGINNQLNALVNHDNLKEIITTLTKKGTDAFKYDELSEELKKQAAKLSLEPIELNLVNFIVVDLSQTVSTALIQNITNETEIAKWVNDIGEIKLPPSKEFSLRQYIEDTGATNYTEEALSIIATGIYETILPSNFNIVERHISTKLPQYAKLGYEALFEKDNKDFIIYNVNPHEYTLSFTLIENGLQVQLIGANFPNEYKVELVDEEAFPPKTIKQFSSTLKLGQIQVKEEGKAGQKVIVYRHILLDMTDLEVVKISEDYYPPTHKIEVHSIESPEAPNEDEGQIPSPDGTDNQNGTGNQDPNGSNIDPDNPTNPDGSNTDNNDDQDLEDGPDDELWDDPDHMK